MATATAAVEAAINDVERLRRVLKKTKSKQVRSSDELTLSKATASAWFENHRKSVGAGVAASADLAAVDSAYREIFETSHKHGARSKYLAVLSSLRRALVELRTECMAAGPVVTTATSDQPPEFSPLIGDPAMQEILRSRWNECLLCLQAKASLAATVMMGGLLEALLLARINAEANKAPIFTARSAPRNQRTDATKPLGEWMLNDFIQVLSELRWITVSASAVGAVLRDYRNYIHPQKQLSHNMHLTPADAELFWEVTKNIIRQIVKPPP